MSPHTQHDTSDDKPWPSTTNRYATHAPAYTTRHNSHPTIANHAKPSPHACHGIRNPTEPTTHNPNNTPNHRATHATAYTSQQTPHSLQPRARQPSRPACPGIHNATEPPSPTPTTHPITGQRMPRHTEHNRANAHHALQRSRPHHLHTPTYESRHIGRQTLAKHHQSSWPVSSGMHNTAHQPTNPVTKASDHRDPHVTTYATRRITYPVSANPAICEPILTQSPTGPTASDNDLGRTLMTSTPDPTLPPPTLTTG